MPTERTGDLRREKKTPPGRPRGARKVRLCRWMRKDEISFEGSLLFVFDSSPTRNGHRRNSIYCIGLSRGTFTRKVIPRIFPRAHSSPPVSAGITIKNLTLLIFATAAKAGVRVEVFKRQRPPSNKVQTTMDSSVRFDPPGCQKSTGAQAF